jgi:predicted AlkP superfamily pyrophosphatase or phosphodiesterase
MSRARSALLLLALAGATPLACGGNQAAVVAPAPATSCASATIPTATTIATAPSTSASTPATQAPRPRVVLISIDGLRPEYLLEADARGEKIPNLRKLLASGAVADGVEGTWPTVTYPAHTTLVTGVSPNTHGILGNHPFDPKLQNDDGWFWYAPEIKAPTLWSAAHAAGKTVGSVYWPVTVGAPEIDWNFPQFWRTRSDFDDPLMRALATPGLAAEVEAAYHTLPAEHRSDKERADAAEHLLKTKRPELTLVYFTDLDTVQHGSGPFSPGAYQTLEAIDEGVGRLIAATEAAGTRRETTFVIVSDHGFASIQYTLRPLPLFVAGQLVKASGGRVTSWEAAIWPNGGSCGVYLSRPDDAALKTRAKRVLDAFVKEAGGGAKVHEGKEVEARGGFRGATWVLEAAEGFVFSGALVGPVKGPSHDRGAHGYPPTMKAMRASFLASGAHVKPGRLGAQKMIDVAPTVARWLSVALPTAEGKPIEAAISH